MTDSPFEEIIETLAGMRQDGLIRHIGRSNVSADQLRTALSITDIAAVTVQYNVAVRLGATPQQVALAWQLSRTERALPIPGTTSVQHLRENLAAAHISLAQDEVDAITALAPEENRPPPI